MRRLRNLREYEIPPIDLCLTSPPYTNESDTDDPFVDYRQKGFRLSILFAGDGQDLFTGDAKDETVGSPGDRSFES